jgi:ABC-2 type transport system permease protein
VSDSAFPVDANRSSFASKFFEFLGVDEVQFRVLLRTGFLIDLRGSAQAASAGQSSGTPLKSSLILYAVYSAFLAFLAFVLPVELYARVMMIFGMTLLGMIMLVDFGVTLVVPDDMVILAWRPISSRTYFAAKLTNALAFIALFGVALFTIPSITGAFARSGTMLFTPVFLVSAILGAVFVAGLVAASYAALLRMFSAERFRSAVNYLQIAMMATLMVGSQIGPRLEGRSAMRQIVRRQVLDTSAWSWWDLMPPRWFCAPNELLLGGANARTITLSVVAFAGTALLFIVLTRSLSLSYLQKVHGSGASAKSAPREAGRPSLILRIAMIFFRTDEEIVMFNFIRRVLARDRQVRLRIYPMMAYWLIVMPAILIAPSGASEGHLSPGLLKIAPLVVLTLLPGVILPLLPYAGETQGAWIFDLTGLEDTASAANGIKKTVACLFLIPLAVLCLAGLAFFMSFRDAAISVAFGLSAAILLMQIEFIGLFSGLPFTRKMAKGRAASNIAYMLLGYLFIGVLGALAYFVLNTSLRLLIATGVMLAGAAVVNRIGNAAYQPFDITPIAADADEPAKLFQ